MAAISVQNVTKIFGRLAALRDVSCDFARGRCYAIFGDNGAGKSTLLRIIAGLARPTQGEVRFTDNGKISTGMNRANHPLNRSAILRTIGYMAHTSMLYDEMSAMENLHYFASLYGKPDENKLASKISLVELDPGLHRPVG